MALSRCHSDTLGQPRIGFHGVVFAWLPDLTEAIDRLLGRFCSHRFLASIFSVEVILIESLVARKRAKAHANRQEIDHNSLSACASIIDFFKSLSE